MTTIDYKSSVQAQVEQHNTEQKAAANDAAWNEIIDRYAIKDHTANRKMVEDFCNSTITLAKFKFLTDNPPQGFQLDWSDEKTLRAELIEEILQKLHDPTQMRFTEANAKNERVRMQSWTLRMLRNRLNEVVNGQYFAKFSANELKAGLADHRKSNVPRYPGFENLPRTIVPPGFVQALDSGEYLRWCVKHDIAAFRRMCSRYGVQQCDDYRLNRI